MRWITVLIVVSAISARADDWPTFRHDGQRSGVSMVQLQPSDLRLRWRHGRQLPNPAWAGPARWDAFAGIRDLRSMRNYDAVNHPAIANGQLVYGSSAEDAVFCLGTADGEIRWIRSLDGPVRISPTIVGDGCYVGCDDGYAYCLSMADGSILWRFSPVPDHRKLLNNGRLVSPWPVRTGVAVVDGIAYFGASMLPWQSSWLCAVDAATGEAAGEGRFVQEIAGDQLTMEGALLAANQLLVLPQGRIPPRLFRRADGKALGSLKGGGGCFALMTSENTIVYGPGGSRNDGLKEGQQPGKDAIASHKTGNAMVIDGGFSYILSDSSLQALDRSTQKTLWISDITAPFSLIKGGSNLYAGGTDKVVAVDAATGKPVWQAEVDGRVFGLALAGDALFVSTDAGWLYCFAADGVAAVPGIPKLVGNADAGIEPVVAAQPLTATVEPGLQYQFVFGGRTLAGSQAGTTVRNLAGSPDGTILGPVRLVQAGAVEALVLDGQAASVLVGGRDVPLPAREMTVTAWVRIDGAQEWGGIVSAIQDNGDFERGWLLGTKNQKFIFSVVGKDAKAKLSYKQSPEAFRLGSWHHVSGVYDGSCATLYVDGQAVVTDTAPKGDILYPDRLFLELGAYHDDNEYYRMPGMVHEVRIYDRALSAAEIKSAHAALADAFPVQVTVAAGPWLRFVDDAHAEIRWRTATPSPSVVHLRLDGERGRFVDAAAVTEHCLTVPVARHDRIYHYRIESEEAGRRGLTDEYECDTFFNFCARPGGVAAAASDIAKEVVASSHGARGICVVYGLTDGELARGIAGLSQMRVIAFDDDPDKVAALREQALREGIYGTRLLAYAVSDLAHLPAVDSFANLMVSERLNAGEPVGSIGQLLALLCPGEGRLMIRTGADGMGPLHKFNWDKAALFAADSSGKWVSTSRSALPDSGVWTHQYGLPDNSSYGGEALSGARKTSDMEVQWVGRPGPRYQSDRQNRQAAPLAVNGRLYLQGLHRLIGVDAFNGTVLWELETPTMARFNVAHDCANWCADEENIYLAVGDACWVIGGRTGEVRAIRPASAGAAGRQWGYIASVGELLIGSSTRSGTAFETWWGGEAWYDKPVEPKAASEDLAAFTKADGRLRWRYSGGLIINPTITIDQNRVYFLETRQPRALQGASRQLGADDIWPGPVLVALDLQTGSRLWERTLDTLHRGETSVFMSTAEGRLVVVASGQKKFGIQTFSTIDGTPQWDVLTDWYKGRNDHGTAMGRPAIVGGRLLVRPYVFDLASGRALANQMPFIADGHGCGTYACSRDAVLLRSLVTSMWDPESGSKSGWDRLRPGCWLGTIPASGLLLAPETGGGCSCGSWMETSVVFFPRKMRY